MVNKLDSNEAQLKLSNGDKYYTCDSIPDCLKHVQTVAFSTCEDHFELEGVV